MAAVLAGLTPTEAATNKDLKAMADAFASSAAQGAATAAAKNAMAKTLADADGKNSSNAGGFMGLVTLEQDVTNRLISIPDARTDYTQLLTDGFQTIDDSFPEMPDSPAVQDANGLIGVSEATNDLFQTQALFTGDVTTGSFPARRAREVRQPDRRLPGDARCGTARA